MATRKKKWLSSVQAYPDRLNKEKKDDPFIVIVNV